MIVNTEKHGKFRLNRDFVAAYEDRPVDWGYGALSWVTYKRTYSRDGERWFETCRRVIEGMFTIQRAHCLGNGLPWDDDKAQRMAAEAFERLFSFKWTPAGRGLWMMGTDYVYERGSAPLNSCAFVSTERMGSSPAEFADPFAWAFGMLMLGVGVGFDTKGAEAATTLATPRRSSAAFVVEDSKEGWQSAVQRLLTAFAGGDDLPSSWDVSLVRKAGEPIRGFGGVASGPAPLIDLLVTLEKLCRDYAGAKRPVDARFIVDTMNLIGKCVVAGGVRRSAEIALGSPYDTEYLDLKMDEEAVYSHRWVSNNSILAEEGMDYTEAARRTAVNGEPGYFWLDNARAYGRMIDPPNYADVNAKGTNPCFAGDTLVSTTNGDVPIRTLAQRPDKGRGVLFLQSAHNIPFHTRRPDKADAPPLYYDDDLGVLNDAQKELPIVYSLAGGGVVSRGVKPVVEVALEDGRTFRCTPDHKFLVYGEDGWVVKRPISELLGENLLVVADDDHGWDESGWLEVEVITIEPAGEEEVFDVIDTATTTFVANGVITSNCSEQTLWHKELCNLVETYPARHDSLEDFKATLKVAYQYAKTVTLVQTHDASTNAVMLRNRRIGCSMSGVVQAIDKVGYREFLRWCDEGYAHVQALDKQYSDWLCVPRSIKTTSVKPSGSVSLLAGATPGVHWDHSPYYIRRVRVRGNSPLIAVCEAAGYDVEPCVYAGDTMVVSFPVAVEGMAERKDEVPAWRKVALAAAIQRHWADNQVSCTVDFDPATEGGDIVHLLETYEDQLKGISFLPMSNHGYKQAPYEEITREQYEAMAAKVRPVEAANINTHEADDEFCDGETCEVTF